MPEIVCKICHKSKHYPPSVIIKKNCGKYCSRKCYFESQKGKPTWNKGIKKWMTKKHLKALIKGTIERNKRHKLSSEQARINGKKAARQLILFTVHKHTEAIKRSAYYRDWRIAVFKRDNYTCQHCCERGGNLQAHHLKSWAKFPNDRFDINNGITLCIACHNELHF